ncbi:3-phosphoshikimate 1-carboxyvinyltransferase [Peribacillus deserti]|uniref:3-phosphoshikimate 1-carboxyvinyltransferase n=1 Tax=Peribacillus deserti TaxID=673318 RepID=A0A2N5M283_9BACI|nr:3-phosphoshikimate 1-carboxyvinyltransferase [Peribacillus deserti]
MDTRVLHLTGAAVKGEVDIPGDKSISHRAVMFGAVANGKTTIKNFLPGADCLSTIACFSRLGVRIEREGSSVTVYGEGFDGLKEPSALLDTGNSGTTTRLMLGILAGLPFHSVLAGDESIAKRPMSRVVNPLREMGAAIDGRNQGEYTPLAVRGQSMKGIRYNLPVASAQVKSAILLAGLQADGDTIVIEPAKTRDHTENMIQQFGGTVEVDGNFVKLSGPQSLQAADIMVPGDISSAAFFLAAGAIAKKSSIILKNVGLNPTRTGIIEVLKQMGANMEIIPHEHQTFEPAGDIVISSSDLKGVEIGGDLIPRLIDEIPIIALLATQAAGKTVIKDAAELKVKETNRINTVAEELSKLGAKIIPTDDGMIIEGKAALHGADVQSYGDHRIGMMLAVASLIADGEVRLSDAGAVEVSYPQFFEHLYALAQHS